MQHCCSTKSDTGLLQQEEVHEKNGLDRIFCNSVLSQSGVSIPTHTHFDYIDRVTAVILLLRWEHGDDYDTAGINVSFNKSKP